MEKKLDSDSKSKSIEKPDQKIGYRSVAQRLKEAKISRNKSSETLMLLLDCSGSMLGRDNYDEKMNKIELLQEATVALVHETDLTKYCIAILSFPSSHIDLPPTNTSIILEQCIKELKPEGSTPLGEAIQTAFKRRPHRAIVISDGRDTDYAIEKLLELLTAEKEEKIPFPIDCVYIGANKSGEDRLKEIASLTGGIFLKFKDLDAFTKGLKYLAPQHRALLMSSEDVRKLTGASEVK